MYICICMCRYRVIAIGLLISLYLSNHQSSTIIPEEILVVKRIHMESDRL